MRVRTLMVAKDSSSHPARCFKEASYQEDLKLVVECHLSSAEAYQALHPLEFIHHNPGLAILKANNKAQTLFYVRPTPVLCDIWLIPSSSVTQWKSSCLHHTGTSFALTERWSLVICRNEVNIISNGGFHVTVFPKCPKWDFHCGKNEITFDFYIWNQSKGEPGIRCSHLSQSTSSAKLTNKNTDELASQTWFIMC